MFMILFLLQIHVFFITNTIKTLLYFDPLDTIELSVTNGIECIFGGWENDLELEVDAGNGRGKTFTYGPYLNDDNVYGVDWDITDYIIRFTNNSPGFKSIAINCASRMNYSDNVIYEGYEAIQEDQLIMSYDDSQPILFTNMKYSGIPISFYSMLQLLIYLNIGLFCCSKCKKIKMEDSVDSPKERSAWVSALFEIISFGGSAGSFLGNIVALFRIFQRLSATSSFKTKFSTDALGLFAWATNIIKIILDKLPSCEYIPAFEMFSIYTFGYTMFMLFFILIATIGLLSTLVIIPLALAFIALGAGLMYTSINLGIGIVVIIISLIAMVYFAGYGYIYIFEFVGFNRYHGILLTENEDNDDSGGLYIHAVQIIGAVSFSLLVFFSFIANVLTELSGVSNIVSILFALQ